MRVNVVINQEWQKGQLSSIQAAVSHLAVKNESDGFMLFLVDHPFISATLVDRLVNEFYRSGRPIVVPTFQGRRGHPVIFARRLYEELLAAPLDKGAQDRRLGTRRRSARSADRGRGRGNEFERSGDASEGAGQRLGGQRQAVPFAVDGPQLMHFPFVGVKEVVAIGKMTPMGEVHLTLGPVHGLPRPAVLGGFPDHGEPVLYVVGNAGRLGGH